MMSNMLKTLAAALFGLLLLPSAYSQTAVPTLIYPIQGAVFLPQTVSFEWNITTNAVAYHLQVSDTLSFSTTTYDNTSILTASQIVPALPNNTDLYWRVRAFDGVDSSTWSSVYRFYLLNPRALGNMQLWVRADVGTVGGVSVSQWADSSGNSVSLTQIDPVRKPTLTTAPQMNNAPVLRFDGNDFLDGGQSLELRTNDQTILIVFNAQNADGIQYRLIQKRGHTSLTDGWCLAPRGFEWNSSIIEEGMQQRGFQNGCCNNDGNYRIVSTVWDNSEATWDMHINSNIPSTTVTNSGSGILNGADITQNNNKIMTIGCSWNSPTDLNWFLNGNIAEIMVYHTALDSVARTRATQYLSTKYAPPLNLGRDIYNHTFCDVTLNASKPYLKNYLWYNLAEPNVLLNNPPSDSTTFSALIVTEPGVYRLKVRDIFGKVSSDTIRVDYPTAQLNAQLPGDTAICGGDTVKIESLLGTSYDYLWSTADTTESIAITTTGLYFVRVTYPGFASCAVTSDSFNVSVDVFSSIAALGADGTYCTGNKLSLVAGEEDAVSYLWSDSSTGAELILQTSGTYWVIVADSLGCVATDTVVATVIPGILPNVAFTADSVCFGLATPFNNNSTITSGSIASYEWRFGDNTTDTASNPVHQYNASGYYSVRLTATSDIGCSNELTKSVVVFATPTIDYFATLDSAGCVQTAYVFFDSSFSSTPPDVVNQWHWDFGNGDSATVQNPTYTYDSVGTYDITLSVETQYGCVASDINTVILLDGIPDPEPFSLYNPPHGTVTANSTINFNWNPSLHANHYLFQIATDTNFTVNSLVLQTETFTPQYTVQNLAAGAYYWRAIALNICGTQVIADFFPLTIFGNSFISDMQLWLKADADVLVDSNNFVSAWLDQSGNGRHMLQPTVANQPLFLANGLNIDKEVVRFNISGTTGSFMDGGNVLDLGNKDQTLFVVFTSYNIPGPTEQYRVIQKRGTPNQSLDYAPGWCIAARGGRLTPSIIQDANDGINFSKGDDYQLNNGCFRMLTTVWDNSKGQWQLFINGQLKETEIDLATADRSYVTPKHITLGCAWNNGSSSAGQTQFLNGSIAEVFIFDNALDNNARKTVEEYLRQKYFPSVNLGQDRELSYGFCSGVTLDAGACQGCSQPCQYRWSTGATTRTIVAPGQGVFAVTVTDGFGFTSSDSVIIKGGFNSVSFDDTVYVCLGDTLLWDTKLTLDGYDFLWQDGSVDSFYKIASAGQYYVYVEDTIDCSFRSDTVTVLIDSFSVFATLGSDTLLCAKNTIALTVGAESARQYQWNDGTTNDELAVFTTDDYSVTAANVNRCIMTDTLHVEIVGIAPDANFSFNRTCLNDSTFFTDITPQLVGTWRWNFDDNSPEETVQNPAHLFAATGFYDVKLTVKDTGICLQSITKTIEVLQLPDAGFTNDLTNCANDIVRFFAASTAPSAQTVTDYYWTFDAGNASANVNPVHNFPTAGFYPISLEVTTDSGCSSIAYDTLEIFSELVAAIGVGNFCFDYPTDFYDASPGFSNISWYWNFGNFIGFSTEQNPIYNYFESGTYPVSLKVTNAIGCERTVIDTIIVTARPTVDFDNPSVCEDEVYQFADSTIINGGDIIVSRQWNFGDQSPISTLQNPAHVYDSAATYNVTLTVQTRNGCENFATKPVIVLTPPTAAFTFTPDYGAAPLDVTFANQSQNGTDYLWDFGDGATSIEISPEHTYLQDESVIITLTVVNAAGCTDIITAPLNISLAKLDIGIDRIIVEKIFNLDCSYFLKMGAYVLNVGTRDVASFDITASNSNGGTIQEHWEGNFSNRQVTYPFNADFLINDCSEDLIICMEVKNPNGEEDENPLNNYTCITLNPELVVIGPSPNPMGDLMHLDIITPSKGDLRISNFNAIGQNLGSLQQGQLDKGFHQYKFDMSHLAQGVYLLRIQFNEESRVIKYTKQ
mgnify:CR=1 FL=1